MDCTSLLDRCVRYSKSSVHMEKDHRAAFRSSIWEGMLVKEKEYVEYIYVIQDLQYPQEIIF